MAGGLTAAVSGVGVAKAASDQFGKAHARRAAGSFDRARAAGGASGRPSTLRRRRAGFRSIAPFRTARLTDAQGKSAIATQGSAEIGPDIGEDGGPVGFQGDEMVQP